MAPRLNLSHFFKGSFEEAPDVSLQALMRSILIRTQFLPTVRHVIGWRGLKQAAAAVEGWTAKIRDYAGVFGQFFMGVESTPGWATGLFGLCYFPDPKEPLVERCSLRAAAFTQTEDYRHCIRDFLRHPEMCELFGVGSLLLSLRTDRHALALALESASALRTVAADGVRLEQEGQLITLVEPGLWNALVLLGYGDGDFDAFCSTVLATKSAPIATARADSPEAAASDYRDKLWWRAHQLKDSKSVDKKILGVDERPPLIILTGFLGSGKTSFLQHFIEYQTQRSRFVAVIQNEIGAIGLDGKLLDYKVTEIDEGCVCCSLVGNLKRAIHGILESFSPDYVILETSGLANPLNLIEEIAGLEDTVRFDCTVTVVDALNFDEALADYRIALDQIRAPDALVLNKCDLVSEAHLQDLRQRLQELNPNAPVLATTGGDVNPALILDGEENAAEAGSRQTHALTGSTEGPSRQTHIQDRLWSRSLTFTRKLDRGKFTRAVESLPRSIFRAKGIIEMADPPQTMLFQYVAGRYDLSAWPQARTRDRFLTLIGKSDDAGGFCRAEQLLRAAET